MGCPLRTKRSKWMPPLFHVRECVNLKVKPVVIDETNLLCFEPVACHARATFSWVVTSVVSTQVPFWTIFVRQKNTTVGLWVIYDCEGSRSGISHFVEDWPGFGNFDSNALGWSWRGKGRLHLGEK
jgi:hypothetical protein